MSAVRCGDATSARYAVASVCLKFARPSAPLREHKMSETYLGDNVTFVVISQSASQLVVRHIRSALPLAPQSGQPLRVDDAEFPVVAFPYDDGKTRGGTRPVGDAATACGPGGWASRRSDVVDGDRHLLADLGDGGVVDGLVAEKFENELPQLGVTRRLWKLSRRRNSHYIYVTQCNSLNFC